MDYNTLNKSAYTSWQSPLVSFLEEHTANLSHLNFLELGIGAGTSLLLDTFSKSYSVEISESKDHYNATVAELDEHPNSASGKNFYIDRAAAPSAQNFIKTKINLTSIDAALVDNARLSDSTSRGALASFLMDHSISFIFCHDFEEYDDYEYPLSDSHALSRGYRRSDLTVGPEGTSLYYK